MDKKQLKKDLGVVYKNEDGLITSWNDRFVFVRFKSSNTSQGVNIDELDML